MFYVCMKFQITLFLTVILIIVLIFGGCISSFDQADLKRNDADKKIEIINDQGYQTCKWYPNPNSYPEYYEEDNKIHKATVLHRVTKDCETNEVVKEEELIKLKNEDGTQRYCNYICRDRYEEQCIKDGSFDKYYSEWCEYE